MKKVLLFLLLCVHGILLANAQNSGIAYKPRTDGEVYLQNGKTYTSADISDIKSGSMTLSEDGKILTFSNLKLEYSEPSYINVFEISSNELSLNLVGDNHIISKEGSEGGFIFEEYESIFNISGSGKLTTDLGFRMQKGEVTLDNTTLISTKNGDTTLDSWGYNCKIKLNIINSRFEGGYIIDISSLNMEGCSIRLPYKGYLKEDSYVYSQICDQYGRTADHFIITTPDDKDVPIYSNLYFRDNKLIYGRTYTSADYSDIKSGSMTLSEDGKTLTFDNLYIESEYSEGNVFTFNDPELMLVLKGENIIENKGGKSSFLVLFCDLTITGSGKLFSKETGWYHFRLYDSNVNIENTTVICSDNHTCFGNNMWPMDKIIINNSTVKGENMYRIKSLTLINSAFTKGERYDYSVNPETIYFLQSDIQSDNEHPNLVFNHTYDDGEEWILSLTHFEISPVEGDYSCRVKPYEMKKIIVEKNSQKSVNFLMKNEGTEKIRNISYILNVDGKESTEKTVEFSIPYVETGDDFSVPVIISTDNSTGRKNFTLAITKVNGKDNKSPVTTTEGELYVVDKIPQRRVVVEENTGTWCGWCPLGTYALNMLNNDYSDEVITIAVHSGDPMSIDNYPTYSEYPSAKVNRGELVNPYYGKTGVPYGISELIEEELDEVIPADIKVDATWANEQQSAINVVTETTFVIDDDNHYSIGLVILEDGMHGSSSEWLQVNNYSNNVDDPTLQSLADLPYRIETDYNHVAVAAYEIDNGKQGSVRSIKSSEPQVFGYKWDISDNAVIQDKSRLSVVAILFDTDTNLICNACKTDIGIYDSMNINDISYSNGGSEIFNISGNRIMSPQKGVNIIRDNNGKTRKIIVK